MPAFDITILDTRDGGPVWPDVAELDPELFTHLPDAIWRVVLIGEGMGSGLPSVALRFDLPDGRVIIAETSLMAFASVVIAGRARWPVAFAGGPLEAAPE